MTEKLASETGTMRGGYAHFSKYKRGRTQKTKDTLGICAEKFIDKLQKKWRKKINEVFYSNRLIKV